MAKKPPKHYLRLKDRHRLPSVRKDRFTAMPEGRWKPVLRRKKSGMRWFLLTSTIGFPTVAAALSADILD